MEDGQESIWLLTASLAEEDQCEHSADRSLRYLPCPTTQYQFSNENKMDHRNHADFVFFLASFKWFYLYKKK